MKKIQRWLLLFCIILLWVKIGLGQGVQSLTITPNPACTTTPVSLDIEYYLVNGCYSYVGYTSAWVGNTFNVYLNFNYSGGPNCIQIFTTGHQIINLGTLSAGAYTVNIFDFDLGGGLLQTGSFSVTNCCPTPTGLAATDVHYSSLTLHWGQVAQALGYKTRIKPNITGGQFTEQSYWTTDLEIQWANLMPNTQYECQVRDTCASGLGAWSSSYFVTTLGAGDPYCYSYGNAFGEWINAVQIGSINNTSGNDYGYHNFTTLSTTVNKGQSYPITVTPATNNGQQSVNWRVWIDFNKDNDFLDAGELVVSTAGNDLTPLNTTIAIPTTASTGSTRMRIAMGNAAISGPCDVGGLRDIEDYTVNIAAGTCPTPSGLTATYVHYSSFILSWAPVTGAIAYQTRRRPSNPPNSPWESGSWFPDPSVIWANAIPNTIYECQVRDSCASGVSPWSSSYFLTTLGAGDPYCYSYGNSFDEWINAVQFGSINNTSNNNYGYRNYTNLSTTIQQGQSYPITVTPDTDDGQNTVSWRIWIDFNKDNDFLDAGELVVSTTGNDLTPLNSTISVPSTASTGNTRMRILMAFSSVNGPCDVNGLRDVEDYTVNITAAPTMSVSPSTINVGANSGSTSFTITTNCNSWSITGAPSWITSVSPGTGNGNATVSVQYQTNTSIQSRTATLTISGCGLTQTVTITQDGATPTMSVSPSTINVGANSGSTSFTITTNCTSWSITGAPSWITSVSPGTGNGNATVSVQYQTNTSIQSRTATLTISGCGLTQTVTITQSGATPTMSVSPSTINVGSGSGSTSFTITTNCTSWSITGAPSWITSVSPGTGANGSTTINVQYQQNTSIQSRTATLTISGCGLTQTVVITQSGATPTMSISPSTINVGAGGGSASFTITTNCTSWSISGAPSWITSVSPGTGTNGLTTVNVQYQQNTSIQSRTATLTITGCGLFQTVVITQSGATPTMSVSPSTINVGAGSGSTSFTITTNCTSWSITGAPSWITSVSPGTGSGTTTVSVQYQQNTSIQSRTATLTITGCGLTQTVTIIQSGATPTMSVSPSTLNVGAGSGSSSFTITTNCTSWSITGAPSWITSVSPGSGASGTTTVSIQYQQNTSTQSRTATLTITGCGLTQTLTVIQSGANAILNVSPGTLTFDATGGSSSFTITTNCTSWSISGAPNWLTVSPINGNGTTTVSVQCGQNTTNQPRSATLTVSGCGVTQDVVVTQSGVTLSVSPPTLNVGASSGITSFTVTTNCTSWTVTGAPSWITAVTPSSGNGTNTVNVQYEQNTTSQPRSATLIINGCGLTQTVVVTQIGTTIMSVSPATLNVGVSSGITSFTVTTNCTSWTVTGAPSWITAVTPSSGNGTNTVNVQYEQNTTSQPRSATLIITGCGLTQTVVITQLGGTSFPVPWVVTATGSNHTIILPATMMSDILGSPLQTGDAIGAFFDNNGTMQCGGYGIWTGSTTAFAAYGNDTISPAKNGFSSNEVFKIKVWRAGTGQEYAANASYEPVGAGGGVVSHTDKYANDGISMLSNVVVNAKVVLNIPLNTGWNMISSNVIPDQPNMVDVFAGIASQVIQVKDDVPASYFPSTGLNQIGNWNILKGYKVKATQTTTLSIQGLQVVPENTPIPLKVGWQIIAYLRNSPKNVAEVFSGIQNQIVVVKDNEGKSYIPQFNINTIGNMRTGQGYQVKAAAPVTLTYTANITGHDPDFLKPGISSSLQHFILDSAFNTGNNAIIVVPQSTVSTTLQAGDEIGVFTEHGTLCGAGVYTGENLAVTVWGDDAATNNVQEGMLPGEIYRMKVWKAGEQQEYTAIVEFSVGDNMYQVDDLEVVSSVQLTTALREIQSAGIDKLHVYPNPARANVYLDMEAQEATKMQVSLCQPDGRWVIDLGDIHLPAGASVQTFDLPRGVPTGVYFLKIRTNKGITSRRIFIENY